MTKTPSWLPRSSSAADRVFAKLDPQSSALGCWPFAGKVTNRGYGVVMKDRKVLLAHRVSYEYMVGPIPEGLVLDHLCRVRHCVNPLHLEPVTPGVNSLRGVGASAQSARRTECPRGHAYDTVWIINGRKVRGCLACHRDAERLARSEGRR